MISHRPIYFHDVQMSPKPWLICRFEGSCTVICYCGMKFDYSSETEPEEVAHKLFTHMRQQKNIHRDPHEGRKPNKQEIIDFFRMEPKYCNGMKALVARPDVLNVGGLNYLYSIGYEETQVEACLNCLHVNTIDYKRKIPCCAVQNIQQVTYFGRGLSKNHGIIVVDPSTINYFSVIPTSSPNNQQESNSSCNNYYDYELVVDEETPTYLVIEKISRSAGATDSRDRVYVSQSNNSSTHQSCLIMPKDGILDDDDGDHLENLVVEKKVDGTAGSTFLNQIFPTEPTLEQKQLFCRYSKRIDKSNLMEFAIQKSSERFWKSAEKSLSFLEPSERSAIAALPKLDTEFQVDGLKDKSLSTILVSDLQGAQYSSASRQALFARIMVASYRGSLSCRSYFDKCLKYDLEQPINHDAEIKDLEFCKVKNMVPNFLLSLLASEPDGKQLNELIGFFAFKEVKNIRHQKEEENSGSEGEEDEEEEEEENQVEDNATESKIQRTSISHIKNVLQVLLRAFKLAVSLRVDCEKRKRKEKLEAIKESGFQEKKTRVLKPLQAVLQDICKPRNFTADIAIQLRTLGNLNSIGPSTFNHLSRIERDNILTKYLHTSISMYSQPAH